MSSRKTIKEKLAKKVCEKSSISEIELAIRQKEVAVEMGNTKKPSSTRTDLSDTDIANPSIKKTSVKRSAQRVKTDYLEETKSCTGVIKAKAVKISQAPKKEEPSTSKKLKHELSAENWQPPKWEIMLENIRRMRSNDKAPVDNMGCHKCADENADGKVHTYILFLEQTQRFHKLIALMLSSQTKDETTYHAMMRLREHSLTPEVICNMKANLLENILHPVSFYKNKAKYMQQTSKILIEKYNSDIPNNIKELVALPGVGPKMAHICMATAWNEVTGIGVDVHVHRISNRIGWLPKATKEPEKTRVALESWLPQHLWSEVNHLLVGFGQTTCTPLKPKCAECLNFEICPSATKTVKK